MFRIFCSLLLLPLAAAAQGILFTDDFSDGMADGWLELDTGAEYEVVDECYCISAGENVDYGSSFNADQPEGMSIANYSVYVRFKAETPPTLLWCLSGSTIPQRLDTSSICGFTRTW